MKISTLESKLREKYHILSTRIVKENQVYSTIPAALSDFKDDTIIAYSNDLCAMNSDEFRGNLLWSGDKPDGLTVSKCNWIELRPEDLEAAVMTTDELLHHEYVFQSLRIRMMEMIMGGKGIRGIVDEMGKELNTSIAIIDMSGKIVTYSHPFMINDPLWLESVEKGFCPPFFIEHLRDVREKHSGEQENGPVFRHCRDNQLYYLASRIYISGVLYGYAFMLQTNDDFNPYCREVLEYIGKATTEHVFKNRNVDTVKNAFYDNLLIDIFRGISSEQIKARIYAGEMQFPPRMCIAAVKPRYFQGDNYVKVNLARVLKQLFPQERLVYYHKMMIILFSLTNEAPALSEENMKKLRSLCEQEHLTAGISNPFTKVTSIKHYYEQATKSIELAGRLDLEGNLHEYKNYALYDLINNDAENHKVGFYCHPALTQLVEYDTANGSQLHDTLRSLTKNGFNNGAAATELFLHRNTLVYRKQKIVSLTGIDLEDFDTQFMLKYSFMIEEYLQQNNEINVL